MEKDNKVLNEGECLLDYGLTLNRNDIGRYSRQLILPGHGVTGQKALQDASVLIVGAGGLGCPCSLYLTGAGVGTIGIVDYDTVDLNNIHRQLLFTEESVGEAKVIAACRVLSKINSKLKLVPYNTLLNSQNALNIINQYDVVVDATDNVPTRYLLNDACVLTKRPLVSGSALQLDGQLTVYNYKNGPCYRCIFPKPPPPDTVTNCGDGGVLGVIPGIIGTMQALEVIKLITNNGEPLSNTLLLFDGSNTSSRKVKLRSKNPKCEVCGDQPTITELLDYEMVCGMRANDKDNEVKLLSSDERITVRDYKKCLNEPHVLIDTRSELEFQICRLPNSVNIPINEIKSQKRIDQLQTAIADVQNKHNRESVAVYIVCRRGNDSQEAVLSLRDYFNSNTFKDIVGGLHAWSAQVDSNFPVY